VARITDPARSTASLSSSLAAVAAPAGAESRAAVSGVAIGARDRLGKPVVVVVVVVAAGAGEAKNTQFPVDRRRPEFAVAVVCFGRKSNAGFGRSRDGILGSGSIGDADDTATKVVAFAADDAGGPGEKKEAGREDESCKLHDMCLVFGAWCLVLGVWLNFIFVSKVCWEVKQEGMPEVAATARDSRRRPSCSSVHPQLIRA